MRAVTADSEVMAPVRPRTRRLAGGRSLTRAVSSALLRARSAESTRRSNVS